MSENPEHDNIDAAAPAGRAPAQGGAAEASAPSAAEASASPAAQPSGAAKVLREIFDGPIALSIGAVVAAFVIGGILIAAVDDSVQEAARYFFARPWDTVVAAWQAVSGAYVALFKSAIFNASRDGFGAQIRPFIDTLGYATPLIAAGLGIGLTFRAGLFNIGGRGQMLVGAAVAGWIGFAWNLPAGVHLIVALIGGILAASMWGALVGFIKAKTGAHEVILTIMLNYVAFYALSWMLRTPGLLQAPGSVNPKSPPMQDTAVLPLILGSQYSLHLGFILVIVATVFTWWLIERSSLGFQFRAVGINPDAAKTAGINVSRIYVLAMTISGGLVGLAGVNQILGASKGGLTAAIDAGIGFDAITVALLGRSRPWGIFGAGIIFGAFKAGGFGMQAAEQVPIELVTILQSLIVLFIAAPPPVRAIFFLPGRTKRAPRAGSVAAGEAGK